MRVEADPKLLPDDELLRRLSALLKDSRRVEADLVAHIGEVDARRLFAREAAPSMFAYCTEILHLSEPEAFLRIAVARASRRHPVLLAMLGDGRLHLSGIERLAPHLTEENRDAILKRAQGLSKRQIEELVAGLAPRPDAPATVRKLPLPRKSATAEGLTGAPASGAAGALLERPARCAHTAADPGPSTGGGDPEDRLRPDGVVALSTSGARRQARIQALAPARYKVQFTASVDLRDKLERLQALMRSSVPDGDLATIIDEAVTEKLARLEAKRFAKSRTPRKSAFSTPTAPKSRHIPAAVRRAVHERDGGRCAYRDQDGRQCTERHSLDFHHRVPFARGGDHSPPNLSLVCRAHNNLMAEHDYGRREMARRRRQAGEAPAPHRSRTGPAAHRLASATMPACLAPRGAVVEEL